MREISVDGRIAKDVVKNVSATGREFIKFNLGSNEFGDRKGADGKPITVWFNVVSFNPDHIRLAQYLTKGKPIIVTGQLQSPRTYVSSVTQETMVSMDIVAHNISFVLGGERNESNGNTTEPRGVNAATEEVPKVTRKAETPKATEVKANKPTPAVAEPEGEDDLPF